MIKLYDKCSHSNASVKGAKLKIQDPQLNCAFKISSVRPVYIIVQDCVKNFDVSVGRGTQQRN
jgi:hypothetical protein